ncbi:protein-methionine-sulfoxide reductase heme-binding subunit MsrQ [Thalassotalea sp. Y01]|uniref:protein-methionine-sulfoxide reductase heme-binding subunit MsrQ n=1 Tax=Thalassotalea sp. Y01 TaxID=2729613 RepID=UPI00145F08CC|nr:protein-methionine-sulfoxide reductase heme-binding subunit MsrQ [Thalassotalea sp. Y01]NMP17290.1 protein-methionine-sulfoxide reductase heme-binding subunit MsrQ [Thalassotalea sp. Y01]
MAMHRTKIWLLKALIHIAALPVAVYYYYLAISDQFGADPVEAIIHFTGIGALNLLLITLAVSPVARYFIQPWLLNVRRLLGLYAAFYALLHVANFFLFELQLDFGLFIGEVIERPYITVGMVAFVLIAALAITSWSRIRRKMGRSWQKLHNYNYLLTALVTIHFYWSVKSELIEPSIYILVLLVLLSFRQRKFKPWLKALKSLSFARLLSRKT